MDPGIIRPALRPPLPVVEAEDFVPDPEVRGGRVRGEEVKDVAELHAVAPVHLGIRRVGSAKCKERPAIAAAGACARQVRRAKWRAFGPQDRR